LVEGLVAPMQIDLIKGWKFPAFLFLKLEELKRIH
jgi:hypothetical protein